MIHFIVFSKDRPLQLHGYLSSLKKHVVGNTRISVLVKIHPLYAAAYMDVFDEFPDVICVQEDDFSSCMQELVQIPSRYICFGCDDVVLCRDILVDDVDTLLKDSSIIGVSFRLGEMINRGMFWMHMRQPEFEYRDQFLVWNTDGADQDWAYPWDVLGTIFRQQTVLDMWPYVAVAQNPSQFEDIGSRTWRSVTPQRQYASWHQPRCVVPTVNVVQNEFPNGFVGNVPLDAAFLLDCWHHGLVLDTQQFTHFQDAWRIPDFYLKRRTE